MQVGRGCGNVWISGWGADAEMFEQKVERGCGNVRADAEMFHYENVSFALGRCTCGNYAETFPQVRGEFAEMLGKNFRTSMEPGDFLIKRPSL